MLPSGGNAERAIELCLALTVRVAWRLGDPLLPRMRHTPQRVRRMRPNACPGSYSSAVSLSPYITSWKKNRTVRRKRVNFISQTLTELKASLKQGWASQLASPFADAHDVRSPDHMCATLASNVLTADPTYTIRE